MSKVLCYRCGGQIYPPTEDKDHSCICELVDFMLELHKIGYKYETSGEDGIRMRRPDGSIVNENIFEEELEKAK
jgi:hypothetical protein